MDKNIKNYLSQFKFGDLQHHKNMGVYPLFCELNHEPEYITLADALEQRLLDISEVSHEGSVPELKVKNRADTPVLLLDGEELAGAKQNRVLNTTILLEKKSETVIPVSCTEQGRWSYAGASQGFHESGTVMIPKMRMMKARDVSDTLADSQQFRSDQGTVWTAIDEMSRISSTHSETRAMKDVFEAKKEDLDKYLDTFTCLEGQKGLVAFIDQSIVGFDFLSREAAYSQLHLKLVKSYAMEALLNKEQKTGKPDVDQAHKFLKTAAKCEEKKYRSVGLGWDYRYKEKDTVGSALKVEKKAVHIAFFRVTESERAGRMADSTIRRRFRTV